MTTLRESYDKFFALYGDAVEPNSPTDALMRGAFSAGILHALTLAPKLDADEIMAALKVMNSEIEELWERRKENPDG